MTSQNTCPIRGIAVLGLNGAGKSTLAHALAKATGFLEMDVEDFYFPQQRAARLYALEHDRPFAAEACGELPYAVSRTKEEAESAILSALPRENGFILAGVTLNFRPEILYRIDLAVELQVPPDIRMQRIRLREERRFGSRVLPGGDMYTQQEEFRRAAAARDPNASARSISRMQCPVLQLDGTRPVEENLQAIFAYLHL